jgi:drug/metabolite transporter (DMT)-like permease
MGVTIGLLAALFFGSGDFLGGRASSDAPARTVLLVSQASAAIGAIALVLVIHGDPVGRDLAYGAAAGAANGVGLGLLYRGLAGGTMGVVAPVTAVVGAMVPVAWGVARGERPDALVFAGVAVAVAAAGLISRGADDGARGAAASRALLLAVAAGAALGTSFVLFAHTSERSGPWAVLTARATAVLGAAALALARRHSGGGVLSRRTAGIAIGAGACDVLATTFLVVAIRRDLSVVVAPVVSLAPGFTVLWAWMMLREPLSRLQSAGLLLALCGLAMIAGG